MIRSSYKTALRAKGIKPIPAPAILRSSLRVAHDHITHEEGRGMKLARIVLPERDNNNGTLYLQHEQLRRDLIVMWGGYTAYKGAGAWKSDKVYTEVVWIYDIAMDRADTPKLRILAESVAKYADQDCVMIVTPNGDVEFVKARVDSVALAS